MPLLGEAVTGTSARIESVIGGSGSGGTAVRFAVLAGRPALSAADFLVV